MCDAPESVLQEIRVREARVDPLGRERDTLYAQAPDDLYTTRLKRALCEHAARFKDTLHADVAGARQALRRLLVEPLTFKPIMGGRNWAYAFEGRTRVGALLDPVYMEMASPMGFALYAGQLSLP